MATVRSTRAAALDPAEVERFGRLANEWWDPNGKFRPLHELGPTRVSFIRKAIEANMGVPPVPASAGPRPNDPPLAGLRLLDIGCGGGLTAEPLARLGATVTAIDPAAPSIAAARIHAADMGLTIDYRATTLEALLDEMGLDPTRASDPTGATATATSPQANSAGGPYDVVVCLEVIEHVPDVPGLVGLCLQALRPGGVIVFSTINRTAKAFGLAILGAEYVLGWLERGTHRWDRFVTPDELESAIVAAGGRVTDERGLVYRPLSGRWVLSDDTDVNYFLAAVKAK